MYVVHGTPDNLKYGSPQNEHVRGIHVLCTCNYTGSQDQDQVNN